LEATARSHGRSTDAACTTNKQNVRTLHDTVRPLVAAQYLQRKLFRYGLKSAKEKTETTLLLQLQLLRSRSV